MVWKSLYYRWRAIRFDEYDLCIRDHRRSLLYVYNVCEAHQDDWGWVAERPSCLNQTAAKLYAYNRY